MFKKCHSLALDLRLFDGAAAAGAAAPVGAEGGQASAGDSTNQQPSAAGKGKRANPLANVMYGKQEPAALPAADVVVNAGENTAQAAAEKPTTTTTSDTLEAKKAEFEKLIQGDYKDLFSERIQGIIDKRFKETKTLQAQADKTKPILDMLSSKYGVSDGDVDKLSKAIQDDDSYYEAEAQQKGLTVEQLKKFKAMERENAELHRTREEAEKKQNADRIYSDWVQQSEAIKSTYPNFDLNTEIKNPDFLKMLRAGVGVKAAYQAAHMDEIMGGAMQYTAQKVQQQTVNNIKARNSRPVENGVAAQPGVVVKSDVSKLSPADRREIARRAARGEQIKF